VAQPYDDTPGPGGTIIPGRCALQNPPPGAPPGVGPARPGGVCTLGAAGYAQLVAFAATSPIFLPTAAVNKYHYFLPSFNLKISATDKLQFRLAASKVMTRPDTALIRPYQQITIDGNGNFTNTVGNPYLKPATAWQFDATAEWYFSRVGSLTVDFFYKDVTNFFYDSVTNSPISNNGVTFNQLTRGPANFSGHGKIKGAEIAYQQTFDFLPGFLKGFGVSANYTKVRQSGANVAIGVPPYTYNLAAYYESKFGGFRVTKNFTKGTQTAGTGQNGIPAAALFGMDYAQVDFTSRLNLGELVGWHRDLQATFDIFNVTRSVQRSYFQFQNAPFTIYSPGRTYQVGLRANF